MTTALTIITDAFSNINESESEAAIEAVDAQLALRELNRMMAALNVDVNWTPATSLEFTVTVLANVEDYLVKGLAKRLAGHYEIPVSAQLQEDFRRAEKALSSRYVKIGPADYFPNMPLSYGQSSRLGYSDPDRNYVTSRTTKVVTSHYTATLADDLLLVDCTDGTVTISLPASASAVGNGFEIRKIDDSKNRVYITPNGSELVHGSTFLWIDETGGSETVIANGYNWS